MESTSKSAAELIYEKQVAEGRRKFFSAVSEHLLDYKHNNPHHIVNASNMLIKIFSNVVDNPSEEKFRKVGWCSCPRCAPCCLPRLPCYLARCCEHTKHNLGCCPVQVKAASNAFKNNVSIIRGGEELMSLAGWYPKVIWAPAAFCFCGVVPHLQALPACPLCNTQCMHRPCKPLAAQGTYQR